MRKLLYFFTFALLYLLFLCAPARATVLSACAAALAPGQFVNCSAGMINLNATAVPPGGFDNNPANVPAPGPGYDGPQPAWDTALRKLYIETSEHNNVANGFCPNAYPAYPHSCWKPLWTYDDATNTWTTNGPAPHYTGGQPVEGVHVWGMIAYDNTNKTIYVKKHGWGSNATNNFAYDIFRYCAANSPASYCASQLNDWRQITQYNPASGDIFGQMGWMPTLNGGTLLLFDTNGNNTGCGALNSYREGVGWVMIDSGAGCKFQNPVLNGTPLSVLSPAIYSKTKNVTIFGPTGATTARQWWRINSSGVIAPLDPAPCDFYPTDGGFNHMVDDPADTGDIIVIGCTHAGKMYRLNPTGAAGTQWTLIDGDLSTAGKICNVSRNSTTECGFDFYATPILTYGVIGFWKYRAGGTAEYWLYKTTASSSDITPPTVSLTAPAAGATVAGPAVSVIATASDTVGVVGVQFKLDGVNLQSEDLVAPYAILWNSTTATNGSHTITATARDAAGNTATSAGVSVTVSNASDFASRCIGAFFCNGFDTAGDLGGDGFGNARGHGPPDTSGSQFCGVNNCPTIDTTVKVSGAGAMKFTIPPGGTGKDSGSYWANPAADLSVRFGAGQTWYVQFRQRVTASYADAAANNNKIHWVSGRPDLPGCTPSTSAQGNCFATCTENEVVNQNQYTDPTKAFPRWYTACPGPNNFELITPASPGQYNLENGRTAPGCLYDNVVAGNIFPPNGNCFPFSFDQWVTWSYKITLGAIGTGTKGGLCFDASNPSIPTNKQNCYYGGQLQARAGLDGQPLTEVLNWTGPMVAVDGRLDGSGNFIDPTELKYGKVWFAPYTGAGSVLPSGASIWVDELIMSLNPIPDPGATPDTTNPTVAITSPIPPTSSSATSPITVSGTAADNVAVTSITWTCIQCVTKGGTATSAAGTSISWLIPALDLVAGTNTLNVVAHDAAGNVSTAATLTIAYTPSSTYWVSKSGSDSNGCVASNTPLTTTAKLTIQAGIGCLASGNTLNIRAGTYTEDITDTQFAGKSGSGAGNTYTAPTTVRAYLTEVVTLNGSIGFNIAAAGIVSYVIFQGDATAKNFIVNGTGTGNAGTIQVGQAGNTGNNHHIKFDGLDVRNGAGGANHAGAVTVGEAAASDIWFTNLKVHDFGSITDSCNSGGPSPHAFYIQGPNVIVENTEMYNVPGYGIHNYDQAPGGAGGHSSNNIYRNLYIHNTGRNQPPACLQTVFGIGLVSGSGHAAYNNVIANNTNGIDVANSNNNLVYSNTFYSNTDSQATCCYPAMKHNSGSGNTFRNNLLFGNAINQFDITGASSVTASKNMCSAGCDLTTTQTAAQIFINALAGDFRLRVGSAAIDVGFTLLSPYNIDALGITRPQGSLDDLGPYETGVFAPPVVTIVNPTSNATLGVTSPLFSLGGTSNLP